MQEKYIAKEITFAHLYIKPTSWRRGSYMAMPRAKVAAFSQDQSPESNRTTRKPRHRNNPNKTEKDKTKQNPNPWAYPAV